MDCYEICSDYIDVIVDMSQVYGWDRKGRTVDDKQDNELSSPDAESVITLQNNGKPLYLREINRYDFFPFAIVIFLLTARRYLALVCIMKEGSVRKKSMV